MGRDDRYRVEQQKGGKTGVFEISGAQCRRDDHVLVRALSLAWRPHCGRGCRGALCCVAMAASWHGQPVLPLDVWAHLCNVLIACRLPGTWTGAVPLLLSCLAAADQPQGSEAAVQPLPGQGHAAGGRAAHRGLLPLQQRQQVGCCDAPGQHKRMCTGAPRAPLALGVPALPQVSPCAALTAPSRAQAGR